MTICCRHRQPVAVQGGLTGTVKGQNAAGNEVALSLEKMTAINDFDPINKTLVAQAGCTLQQVREFAAERGLLFPVDIGARGSCTIGGNIATNAGGMEVLRYGMMRHHVLGLEAVMADGTVLSAMNRMQKNNTGYDLKQLFIGSEGTLGIVTSAVLQLQPLPESCETALIAGNSFEDITALLDSAQRQLGDILTRFEVMDNRYYNIQIGKGGHTAPLPGNAAWYALVEVMGFDPRQDRDSFQQWLERLVEQRAVADIVIARNLRQRGELWKIREDFEVSLAGGSFFLYDVSLPVSAMDDYLAGLDDKVFSRWPDAMFFTLGHLADGNLHFFLSPGVENADELKPEADELIYQPLRALGGSVSAEHGIGLDKKPWLGYSRNAEEIRLMQTLKRTLDPDNLLNPGRLFDL